MHAHMHTLSLSLSFSPPCHMHTLLFSFTCTLCVSLCLCLSFCLSVSVSLYSEGVYIWQIHYTQKVCTYDKYIILRRCIHVTTTFYSEDIIYMYIYDSYTQKVCTYIWQIHYTQKVCNITNILYSEGVYIWQIHYTQTQKVCTYDKYIILRRCVRIYSVMLKYLRRCVHMTNTLYSEGVYIWQIHYTQKVCTYIL